MITKDEALKLARRSLKELVPDDSDYAPALQGQRKRQEKALAAIKQALAAPVQPVGKVIASVPHLRSISVELLPEVPVPPEDSLIYTTQPAAQRQWVGLTPREIYNLWEDCGVPFVDWDSFASITRAIEAKLRNKNGWRQQHVTDGNPCWCEPETRYTDPETGASVIVHKDPQ